MDDFLLRALLAGLMVSVLAGVLGCFVVWRRMAYFGDSLSHSALLGVALGLGLGFSPQLGITLICLCFALLLFWLQQFRVLATDTLLGILAHSALAIGMVTISLLGTPAIDLHSYLFGDILTVQPDEVLWIFMGGGVVLWLVAFCWPAFLRITLHEELARAEGVKVALYQLLFMLLMTLVVALSVRVVGMLLITSLLIIPAASARQWARTPEVMAVLAVFIGMLSVVLGIGFSYRMDTPSGPSIVAASSALFVVIFLLARLRKLV